MTTTSEDMYIEIYGGAVDVNYGLHQYTISQAGQLLERSAVCVFSTNMTSIGTQTLYDHGWKQVSLNTLTAEKAFYKEIPPAIAARGNSITISIEIPIDAASAGSSARSKFAIWLADDQYAPYVEQGSMITTIPTAYGMCNEYGLDAIIFARALTVSSGASATPVTMSWVITPA
jgi:hypothetical protein